VGDCAHANPLPKSCGAAGDLAADHSPATGCHDPIKSPFAFRLIAAEVVAGIDLSGKRAIATGASGIAIETARALAGAGAQATLAVRNTDAGARTAADIAC
jgi:hypothetical protein